MHMSLLKIKNIYFFLIMKTDFLVENHETSILQCPIGETFFNIQFSNFTIVSFTASHPQSRFSSRITASYLVTMLLIQSLSIWISFTVMLSSLKNTGQYFVKCPTVWVFLLLFNSLQVVCFGQTCCRSDVSFPAFFLSVL